MSVLHFMGVGRAVGAITCAVDYIEKALDTVAKQSATPETVKLFKGSGGIRHDEVDKGKIEAIVLFTSREVIHKKLLAFPYIGCKKDKQGKEKPGQVRDEIVANLKSVWKRIDPDVGRKIYWCEVEIDNFQDCFDKILKVAYRFNPPGKQGKEIWCNLTGGSNSIGFALMSVARMTAISTKHYLISQQRAFQKEIKIPSQIKEIQPNQDGYFNVIPFLKTSIDSFGFYDILTELVDLKQPVTTQELWSRLKGKQHFTDCSLAEFKRQYMLKLYGLGYTQYDENTQLNEISEFGIEFHIQLEEFQHQLLLPGDTDIVSEAKKWSWFQEVDEI